MSQRNSGRKRKRADLYQTPAWVVGEGLAPFIDLKGKTIVDPCAGPGSMVRALIACGAKVRASDIHDYRFGKNIYGRGVPFRVINFLQEAPLLGSWGDDVDGYAYNPPYGVNGRTAVAFIRRGLNLIRCGRLQFMAVLLPVDFDSGSTRVDLFERCLNFRSQITLRRRIEWFKPKRGSKAKPSQNHAWFIWSSVERHPDRPPEKLYGPPWTISARGDAEIVQPRFCAN